MKIGVFFFRSQFSRKKEYELNILDHHFRDKKIQWHGVNLYFFETKSKYNFYLVFVEIHRHKQHNLNFLGKSRKGVSEWLNIFSREKKIDTFAQIAIV